MEPAESPATVSTSAREGPASLVSVMKTLDSCRYMGPAGDWDGVGSAAIQRLRMLTGAGCWKKRMTQEKKDPGNRRPNKAKSRREKQV
jgi:hypothetical protein